MSFYSKHILISFVLAWTRVRFPTFEYFINLIGKSICYAKCLLLVTAFFLFWLFRIIHTKHRFFLHQLFHRNYVIDIIIFQSFLLFCVIPRRHNLTHRLTFAQSLLCKLILSFQSRVRLIWVMVCIVTFILIIILLISLISILIINRLIILRMLSLRL